MPSHGREQKDSLQACIIQSHLGLARTETVTEKGNCVGDTVTPWAKISLALIGSIKPPKLDDISK